MSNAINKNDIVDAIAESAELSKKDATKAADAFLDCIRNALKNKQGVSLANFGSFEANHRAERKGFNPHTGQPMVIAASYVLKFKAAKRLKDLVNQGE